MSNLTRTPGGAWSAFWGGALSVAAAMIVPVGLMICQSHSRLIELPKQIGLAVLIVCAASALAGVGCAIPRLLYAWAYYRVTRQGDGFRD
jgi:hypothetical protein